jgi:hypothetical protein
VADPVVIAPPANGMVRIGDPCRRLWPMYVNVIWRTPLRHQWRINNRVAVDSTSWPCHDLYQRTLHVASALLDSSDPIDLGAWSRLLSHDAHVRVANRPVAVGHAQCVAELAALFTRVTAVGRQFREVSPSPDGETVFMELDLVPVDPFPALPITIIARIIEPNPLVRDMRLYFDPLPLGLASRD